MHKGSTLRTYHGIIHIIPFIVTETWEAGIINPILNINKYSERLSNYYKITQ